ncbi:hypothetical protein SLEP1_g27620 [Rubroshorea leprosula]|uniref:Uncharacterized protein n=1 Tax=Rubroshorea leprosula TaxID=152421 RepID=A0AAV5JTQ2_9ROSI|nr:hypothetical protein SLEP1_g27620 [Rubroshorea leprosula]
MGRKKTRAKRRVLIKSDDEEVEDKVVVEEVVVVPSMVVKIALFVFSGDDRISISRTPSLTDFAWPSVLPALPPVLPLAAAACLIQPAELSPALKTQTPFALPFVFWL